jgi:hypothetical protein
MKGIIQTFLLIILVTFVSRANAGVLIEPVIGYNFGTSLDVEDDEEYTGGTGLAYGGRIGYQQLGLQLGLDYLSSSVDMKDDDFDKNVDMSEWAAFVGFEFPVLVRVYAGYIFSATATSESQGLDLEMNKGTGTKIGVGFTGLPFVDLNVEYRTGSFKDYDIGTTTVDDKVNYKSIMLSASLPFNL